MKYLLCCLLCLLLLSAPVFAQEDATLDEQMRTLMDEYGLDADNFALRYHNLTTGEAYAFNQDTFFAAGWVWTLPLHMYYYIQEALGTFETEEFEPEFTIGGLTLEQCRFRSIQNADETVAQNMREALGDFRQYQLLINETFGGYDMASLPDIFYTDTYYSAEFLMNCLKAISIHPERYGNLMQSYRLVQKAEGIASYEEAPLVHIRGEAGGMLCDVGEVSAAQPFLVVCFVREETGGDMVLAAVNRLLSTYSQETQLPETTAPTAATRNDSDFQVGTERPNDNTIVIRWIVFSLGIAAGAALIVMELVQRIRRSRKK